MTYLLLNASSTIAENSTAQESPITIYITGSNLPTSVPPAEPALLVIDKAEIARMNPRSVPQLLATLPGLHLDNAMSGGKVSTVYQRGAESNYTLVMVNGVKVNDPTSSRGDAFDFSLLDVNSIERIEVVNGSYSSVYGSAAMAGVINIITTPSADDAQVSIDASIGSNEASRLAQKASLVFKNGSMSVQAAHQDDGDLVAGSQLNARALTFNAELQSTPLAQISFNARFQSSESQSFPEASGGDKYALSRDLDDRETEQQQLGARYKHTFSNTDSLVVSSSFFRTQEDLQSPGVVGAIPANTSNTDYKRRAIEFTYRHKLSAQWHSVAGLVAERERGDNNGTLDINGFLLPASFALKRDAVAAFAEAKYQLHADWYSVMGVRIDKADDFKREISPRLTLSYQRGATRYQFNGGRGFKLPSFFALAHPIVGNENFQPETSESYDVSVQHSLVNKHRINASVFYNRYFDLIDFDDSGVLVARPEVRISGIDVHAQVSVLTNLSFSAHYSLLNINVKQGADHLNKRPERLAGIAFDWLLRPAFHWSLQVNYTGEIRDFAYPTGQRTLDNRARLDTAFHWQLTPAWQLNLALNNVLDERYEETIGAEVSGVSAYLSTKGTW